MNELEMDNGRIDKDGRGIEWEEHREGARRGRRENGNDRMI